MIFKDDIESLKESIRVQVISIEKLNNDKYEV